MRVDSDWCVTATQPCTTQRNSSESTFAAHSAPLRPQLTLLAAGMLFQGEWEAGGTKYDGQWLQDLKHGIGVLTSKEGQRYDGQWNADKWEVFIQQYSHHELLNALASNEGERWC